MSRRAVRSLHLAASLTAVAIVALFLAATLAAEVVGGDAPTEVKHWIARAVVVLVPVMAAAALSGRRLAGGSRAAPVRRKLRRTQVAAAIGVLVLGPCALALDHLSGRDDVDTTLAIVQLIELVAGASNLALLSLNVRDGLAMRARRTSLRARGVARPT